MGSEPNFKSNPAEAACQCREQAAGESDVEDEGPHLRGGERVLQFVDLGGQLVTNSVDLGGQLVTNSVDLGGQLLTNSVDPGVQLLTKDRKSTRLNSSH